MNKLSAPTVPGLLDDVKGLSSCQHSRVDSPWAAAMAVRFKNRGGCCCAAVNDATRAMAATMEESIVTSWGNALCEALYWGELTRRNVCTTVSTISGPWYFRRSIGLPGDILGDRVPVWDFEAFNGTLACSVRRQQRSKRLYSQGFKAAMEITP